MAKEAKMGELEARVRRILKDGTCWAKRRSMLAKMYCLTEGIVDGILQGAADLYWHQTTRRPARFYRYIVRNLEQATNTKEA